MLVALAQTCKTLNTIALHAFFKRCRGEFRTPVEGTLTSFRTPVEMLDATRTALFVKRLYSLTWFFEAGCECDISDSQADPACRFLPLESQTSTNIANTVTRTGPLWRTFDEIANLRAIFSRIQEVRDVCLDFMTVDTWLDSTLRRTHLEVWDSSVDPELWMMFVDLLDNIVDSGCRSLVVRNGEELLRLLPCKDSMDSALTTTSKWKNLNLQSLTVHSDILLRPPSSDWLLFLLTSSACARSLTRLSIRSDMTSLPSSLLVSLNLPNLVQFEMQATYTTLLQDQEITPAKFEDMSAFLGTHSDSLRVVSLEGVEVPPPTRTDTTAGLSFDSNKPVFPKLESFSAHPAYIAWVFNLAVRSQSKITLGSLTTITIKSEDCLSVDPFKEQHFDYPLFNMAFEALIAWQNGYRNGEKVYETRSRTKNKNFTPRAIDLNLQFVCQHGLDKWFASHLPPAQVQAPNFGRNFYSPAPSILTQLTCIRTLVVSDLFSDSLSEETVNLLPDWLALISNANNSSGPSQRGGKHPETASGTPSGLQKFDFVDFEGDKDQFIGQVAEKCIGLKWVQVGLLWNNPTVNLDEFRAGASMENANDPNAV
ncbi:hypothetical protein GALMADRAFT_210111 [Galerina marginata CBS 339.88]|uniref:Uncharacterized protein n=1 Tax=Galerina marginata (strain CBS 339.88) TaxID=685588 RepID=A0A067TD64_GALM3|nr:hypothetical protein GALMADRAFT_210111 [Galerina marginata CBS 339.88]